MQILAIDTTTEACSVALWRNGIIQAHFEICPGRHTQRILFLIKRILDQNVISLTELDALAFSRGPGSFTGVRVGVSIAQGLAFGAELTVIGVSTLAIMAQGAWRNTGITRILAAIDARMGEVYWAEYIRDKYGFWHGEESEMILKTGVVSKRLEQLSGEWGIVGTGWKTLSVASNKFNVFLRDCNILLPEAKDILPIAYQLLISGKNVPVEKAEPIYLRHGIVSNKLSN